MVSRYLGKERTGKERKRKERKGKEMRGEEQPGEEQKGMDKNTPKFKLGCSLHAQPSPEGQYIVHFASYDLRRAVIATLWY